MSPDLYPESPGRFEPFEDEPPAPERPSQRLWLHLILLLATLFTTTLVGAHMQYNFDHNLPFFSVENFVSLRSFFSVFTLGLQSASLFCSGLPFSLTLLTILMAHELGHFLTCAYYGLDATLPFFLPSPIPVMGTFGAFIRIRSPIRRKELLFDVGIAGPLAGFVFLIPALGVGLAFSKVLPGINHQGIVELGVPALQLVAQRLIFPGVPAADIYLHPVARAAWVGMFATAVNLLPMGQLDGGHILYALVGRRQVWVTNAILVALLPLGILRPEFREFWLMGLMVLIFARKHPPLYDESDLGESRVKLGIVALLVFLLCLSLIPYDLRDS